MQLCMWILVRIIIISSNISKCLLQLPAIFIVYSCDILLRGIEENHNHNSRQGPSHVATYHLNLYLLETIKTFILNIEKVSFWSDGYASHFKSHYVIQDIAHLDSSITIDWNYLESHHGKGAVDGIGACLKQKVFKHVKSLKVILSNAEQFANYTNKVVDRVIYHATTTLQYLSNSSYWNKEGSHD